MPDTDTTINPGSGSDAVVLFDSSPDSPPEPQAETPSAETQNTEPATGTEPNVEPQADEDTRFDKHPRFKQLLSSEKTLKQQIAAMEQKLAKLEAPPAPPRNFDAELDALDAKLAEGDIDLATHQKQTRQIQRELANYEREQAQRQTAEQYQARELQDAFLKDHGFVKELLDTRSDEIDALIQQYPLHDSLSAALALRVKELETAQDATVQKAVAEAVAAKEKEMLANFKAKQTARSLSEDARSVTAPDLNAPLKDTAKMGGVKQALAGRLKALRSGA